LKRDHLPKKVIKKDGETEPFIKEKIVVSAVKTGAHVDIARDIADKIEKKLEKVIDIL
jgi:transcriptional regulator NrdR family protein